MHNYLSLVIASFIALLALMAGFASQNDANAASAQPSPSATVPPVGGPQPAPLPVPGTPATLDAFEQGVVTELKNATAGFIEARREQDSFKYDSGWREERPGSKWERRFLFQRREKMRACRPDGDGAPRVRCGRRHYPVKPKEVVEEIPEREAPPLVSSSKWPAVDKARDTLRQVADWRKNKCSDSADCDESEPPAGHTCNFRCAKRRWVGPRSAKGHGTDCNGVMWCHHGAPKSTCIGGCGLYQCGRQIKHGAIIGGALGGLLSQVGVGGGGGGHPGMEGGGHTPPSSGGSTPPIGGGGFGRGRN